MLHTLTGKDFEAVLLSLLDDALQLGDPVGAGGEGTGPQKWRGMHVCKSRCACMCQPAVAWGLGIPSLALQGQVIH